MSSFVVSVGGESRYNKNMKHFIKDITLFILTVGLLFGSLICVGILLFTYFEGWSLVDAFYFTVMTVTTVGYGDLVPTHDISKIVTACYSLISIPLVLFMFTYVAREYFELRISNLEDSLRRQLLQEEEEIEEIVESTVLTKPKK